MLLILRVRMMADAKKYMEGHTPSKYWSVAKKNHAIAQRFKKMKNPMIQCIKCGKMIWHDHLSIQRHMDLDHIRDRAINQEVGWKFVPGTGRNKKVI